jgi:CheY-like chemotaxis protein
VGVPRRCMGDDRPVSERVELGTTLRLMALVAWIGRRGPPSQLVPLLAAEGLELRAFADASEAISGLDSEEVAAAIFASDGSSNLLANIEQFAALHAEAQVLAASDAGVPRPLVLALCAGASGILEFKSQSRSEILWQIREWAARHERAGRERDLLFRLRSLNEDFLKQMVAAQKRNLQLEEQLQPEMEPSESEGPPRLLVVDDEEAVRGVLEMLLSRKGYAHAMVHSGEAAVDALSRDRFDLVITDKNLPGISGLDVLREVKARSPDTEVILMTGYASMDSAITALNHGASAYLEKPFEHVRVVGEKIDAVLQRRRERFQHRRYLLTIKERNKAFLDRYKVVRADLEAWLETLGPPAVGGGREIRSQTSHASG